MISLIGTTGLLKVIYVDKCHYIYLGHKLSVIFPPQNTRTCACCLDEIRTALGKKMRSLVSLLQEHDDGMR